MPADHFVSRYCGGELCHWAEQLGELPCGAAAEHKIEEVIFDDDPMRPRHPLTAYLCHEHYRALMGPMADEVRKLQAAMLSERS